jgi:molecular chaperone GrpE (heat shock protein)
MTQDRGGKNLETLLQGEVALKDIGLAEDRKWLVDAGVEKIEWQFFNDDGWPLLVVRVKADESRPEDETGGKPWESVTWKVNIPQNQLGKNFKGVFAELPLKENADFEEQSADGDVFRAEYRTRKNSFELALRLFRPPNKAPAWLDEKGFRLLFMESKTKARVTIQMEADRLLNSINNFGRPDSKARDNDKANDAALAGRPSISAVETPIGYEQEALRPQQPENRQELPDKGQGPALFMGHDAHQIALDEKAREHENRTNNLLAQIDKINSDIYNISRQIENLNREKLPDAATAVAGLEKRLKDIAEAARRQASAVQPREQPFSTGALPEQQQQELVDRLASKILTHKVFEQGVRDALVKALAQPEHMAHLFKDEALSRLLADAVKEKVSPLISNVLSDADKPDGVVSNILKGLLENPVNRLLPQNESSQKKLAEIAGSILKGRITQLLPDKSMDQHISRIIQEASWPQLEKRLNESLAAVNTKINDCIQKTDDCKKSLAELELGRNRPAVLAMPDWDGIANWLIRACLGMGHKSAAIDLKNWYKDLLNRVAELLPINIGKLDKPTQKEITLLLGPLTARYNRILRLFGEAAISAPNGHNQDAGRALKDSFYQGFVENVVAAFKMPETENSPPKALPSPFEYGWQMVENRLAEARQFSSQGKRLPGFEEIRQQFAGKEIFDLVHTNRTRVMALHEKVPHNHRKSLEELDEAFKKIEEFAGLERIAPEPGQDYLDEMLHSISKQVSEKEFFPNQVTEVDRIGYRLKSTGEVLARARVVVNRRSS